MIEKELKIRDMQEIKHGKWEFEDYYGEWEDYVDYYNGEILDIIENFPAEESASIKGE